MNTLSTTEMTVMLQERGDTGGRTRSGYRAVLAMMGQMTSVMVYLPVTTPMREPISDGYSA